MNIIFFYIVLLNRLNTVHLASYRFQPDSMPPITNPSRVSPHEVTRVETVMRTKPTCGPVSFPDYSCENPTAPPPQWTITETTTWKPQVGLFNLRAGRNFAKGIFGEEITSWKPIQGLFGKPRGSLLDAMLHKNEETTYDIPTVSLARNIEQATQRQRQIPQTIPVYHNGPAQRLMPRDAWSQDVMYQDIATGIVVPRSMIPDIVYRGTSSLGISQSRIMQNVDVGSMSSQEIIPQGLRFLSMAKKSFRNFMSPASLTDGTTSQGEMRQTESFRSMSEGTAQNVGDSGEAAANIVSRGEITQDTFSPSITEILPRAALDQGVAAESMISQSLTPKEVSVRSTTEELPRSILDAKLRSITSEQVSPKTSTSQDIVYCID